METLRRLILVFAATASICLFFHSPLADLVVVSPLDPASALDHDIFDLLGESESPETIGQAAYVGRIRSERLARGQGEEWEQFVDKVSRSFDLDIPSGWEHRCEWSRFGGELDSLWFTRNDVPSPLGELPPHGRAALASGSRLFTASLMTYDTGDFQWGTGLAGVEPPTAFLYPWRFAAPWVLAAGLLAYFLLPRPRLPWPKAMRIPGFSIVMGDLLMVILFAMFFSLPMFVVGPVMAVDIWWPLALALWPLAMLSLVGLAWSAVHADFFLNVDDAGLAIHFNGRIEHIPYGDIAVATPLVCRWPRWLSPLLMIAGLMAGGSSAVLGMGQAAIAGSSRSAGVHIARRNGPAMVLRAIDMLSGVSGDATRLLPRGLARAGVTMEPEPRVLYGFIATPFRIEGVSTLAGLSRLAPLIFLTPFLLFAGFLVLGWLGIGPLPGM